MLLGGLEAPLPGDCTAEAPAQLTAALRAWHEWRPSAVQAPATCPGHPPRKKPARCPFSSRVANLALAQTTVCSWASEIWGRHGGGGGGGGEDRGRRAAWWFGSSAAIPRAQSTAPRRPPDPAPPPVHLAVPHHLLQQVRPAIHGRQRHRGQRGALHQRVGVRPEPRVCRLQLRAGVRLVLALVLFLALRGLVESWSAGRGAAQRPERHLGAAAGNATATHRAVADPSLDCYEFKQVIYSDISLVACLAGSQRCREQECLP